MPNLPCHPLYIYNARAGVRGRGERGGCGVIMALYMTIEARVFREKERNTMDENANPNTNPAYYLPYYPPSCYPPAYCPPIYVLPYTDPAYYPLTYVPYALYAAAPVVSTHYSPVGYNYVGG